MTAVGPSTSQICCRSAGTPTARHQLRLSPVALGGIEPLGGDGRPPAQVGSRRRSDHDVRRGVASRMRPESSGRPTCWLPLPCAARLVRPRFPGQEILLWDFARDDTRAHPRPRPKGRRLGTRRLRGDPESSAASSVDCVITTSPFESTHLIGLGLGAGRPPWIADLRDGWTFESWRRPLPLAVQRGLDLWLERGVLSAADAVTALPRAVARDVRSRFGRPAHHISDGWDPELEPVLADTPALRLRPDR